MISALPILIAITAAQTTKRVVDVKLIDMTPVTQATKSAVFKMSKEFSIGGVILKSGILLVPQGDTNPDRSGRLVYAIPRGATTFHGLFGIPDSDTEGTGDATMTIYIDGEKLQDIYAINNQKAIRFDASVKGAKSIMLSFAGTAALADASFAGTGTIARPVPNAPSKTPAQAAPSKLPSEMGRVSLTAPENGDIEKDAVTFKWDPVSEATSYGVEIVMISNADPRKTPTRYLRAFSAKNESFEWNFSEDVLSGEYQVSVIAFGKRGVLTKFSNSRRFKVVRN
jgi:hypothetical protein